jgi:hypothetical protein
MISPLKSWIRAALAVAVLVAAPAGPAWSAAPLTKDVPARVTQIGFEDCEPFQVRAKVMEVRAERGTFVVAESEICEMDVVTGKGRLQTVYHDLAGQPDSKRQYRVGQYLFVKGYLLPAGNVAAIEVREIEKPKEARVRYKPIANQGRASRRSAGADRGQQP